jgi:hypothetical protein
MLLTGQSAHGGEVEEGEPHEQEATSAEQLAESLADSPVYVDSAYDAAFPAEERERIEQALADGPVDLYVMVVPLIEGDDWNGDAETLMSAVNDRMGAGERHFLAYEQGLSGGLTGKDFTSGTMDPVDRAAFYGALASDYEFRGRDGATIAERLEEAIEVAFSAHPEAGYDQAVSDYEERRPDDLPAGGGGLGAPWAAGLAAAAAAVLAAGAVLLYRRRGRPVRAVAQHAAFDNADRARLESLVERCERDLIELGERLSAATGVSQRNLARALDARDAAARVHDQMLAAGPTLPDAAGVLVLLDQAEDALAGRSTPRRPCYANPLHGTHTRAVDWREFGGTRTIRVPLCRDCARAVRGRVRPTVLAVEHEGRSMPYYEVPAEASVWAATGFGALGDDVVQRILAGEHRR